MYIKTHTHIYKHMYFCMRIYVYVIFTYLRECQQLVLFFQNNAAVLEYFQNTRNFLRNFSY